MVIATRPGNPLKIKSWDDILTKDIEIINANPFTSGGARWNVMAVYGQVIKGGGTEEEGAGGRPRAARARADLPGQRP